MSKRKFPIVVKRGNVRVKIYFTPSNDCDAYTVAYYFANRRVRKTFADLGQAQLEAETAANRICAGELDVLTLTSTDRTAYLRSLELLKPSGLPLELAVMQFAEAERILHGRSLVEAVKFFAKHHNTTVVPKRLADVAQELLAARQSEGVSPEYLRSLASGLKRLAKVFNTPINMILASELQDYLRDLRTAPTNGEASRKFLPKPLSPVSKNNARKMIRSRMALRLGPKLSW